MKHSKSKIYSIHFSSYINVLVYFTLTQVFPLYQNFKIIDINSGSNLSPSSIFKSTSVIYTIYYLQAL